MQKLFRRLTRREKVLLAILFFLGIVYLFWIYWDIHLVTLLNWIKTLIVQVFIFLKSFYLKTIALVTLLWVRGIVFFRTMTVKKAGQLIAYYLGKSVATRTKQIGIGLAGGVILAQQNRRKWVSHKKNRLKEKTKEKLQPAIERWKKTPMIIRFLICIVVLVVSVIFLSTELIMFFLPKGSLKWMLIKMWRFAEKKWIKKSTEFIFRKLLPQKTYQKLYLFRKWRVGRKIVKMEEWRHQKYTKAKVKMAEKIKNRIGKTRNFVVYQFGASPEEAGSVSRIKITEFQINLRGDRRFIIIQTANHKETRIAKFTQKSP